jgi:hypothetical protein
MSLKELEKMNDDRLQREIDAVTEPYTEYMSTWDEIKDYYQDEHSEHKWIGAMVHDLTGLSPADGRAYATARRRIERWNDGTTRPGKASKESLAELGRNLPPKSRGVPPGGINISIRGTFYVSKRDGRRFREINIHMDEMQALEWVQDPDYEAIFEEYGVDGDMFAGGMEGDVAVSIS